MEYTQWFSRFKKMRQVAMPKVSHYEERGYYILGCAQITIDWHTTQTKIF